VALNQITNWDELAERAGKDPKKLAELCGVQLRRLERFFEKSQTTPEAFLMTKLHERCLVWFEEGLSVKEVADRAQFVDQFTFSKSFKKYMGVPPSAFRIAAGQRVGQLRAVVNC
jgi:iron complex transport system substrate-binding protein